MKYLPCLVASVLVLYANSLAFQLSVKYSPVIDYLLLVPDLNSHSWEYLLIAGYESLIRLLATLFILLIFRKIVPQSPFNVKAAALIQLPFVLLVVLNFDSTDSTLIPGSAYEAFRLIGSISECVSVLMAYGLIVAYNKFTSEKIAVTSSP
ncbi:MULTISPECIES: hypothetical protein [Shewanella]|uniref:hypothetical protein n=1 Tax=Shewanella TaxID=22 RepID=UPI000C679B97|nr:MULTISPECIES: hypothetical protein [Shewanella]NCQ44153.1 hypothetical protein [Shewanella frigidimarina]NCO71080.1 hypothetical protein [Shewanella vesiculosa]NCP35114.1 hypothetical protein [Shewanella vesiculosa]NCP71015.1 hypothetical protein [Shewanella vesiculosa]NCP73158.1 hypothetical protein [Shewanella vesiculosa]|tara:strand:- start:2498 stop:2950 length:453 start_codon:yes stop_codon:yes gene_type:complete